MSGEVDGHGEERQEETEEVQTGIREGREHDGMKAMGWLLRGTISSCSCTRNKLLCVTSCSGL